MWYREIKSNIEINRTAKPLGLHFNKHKKKKIKHFDDEIPDFNQPIPELEPKTPANITETPDLPAGVKMPPVQFPPEKEHIKDETLIEPKKHHQKPKELEELYGPDNDVKDDSVITSPDILQKNIDSSPPEDLDFEQDIADILDGIAEDEPELEIEPELEPEEEQPEPEFEPDKEQSTQPVPDPPIHEFCHCIIITMPGGRRIWRANDGACSDCLNARDTFNQWQLSLFGS